MNNISFINTTRGITVSIDFKTYPIASSNSRYDDVVAACIANDLPRLRDLVDVKQRIVDEAEATATGEITLVDGEILYQGVPVHNTITDRVLTMIREGANGIQPLLKFLNNLMENPSFAAVNELYGFLESSDLPITPDGYFQAYKMVKKDYTSIYDGKTDNSIRSTPTMARNLVNDDRNQTCSKGLHFCSQEYLGSYGTAKGTRCVVLKINPRDVVSIPTDYNNSKGRACQYEVIGELDNWDVTRLENDYTEQFTDGATKLVEPREKTPKSEPKTQNGAGNPAAKLDDNKVREIRNMAADGWTRTAIALSIGISRRQVGRILDGKAWTHVT